MTKPGPETEIPSAKRRFRRARRKVLLWGKKKRKRSYVALDPAAVGGTRLSDLVRIRLSKASDSTKSGKETTPDAVNKLRSMWDGPVDIYPGSNFVGMPLSSGYLFWNISEDKKEEIAQIKIESDIKETTRHIEWLKSHFSNIESEPVAGKNLGQIAQLKEVGAVTEEHIYEIIGNLLDRMNKDVISMSADVAAIKSISFGEN